MSPPAARRGLAARARQWPLRDGAESRSRGMTRSGPRRGVRARRRPRVVPGTGPGGRRGEARHGPRRRRSRGTACSPRHGAPPAASCQTNIPGLLGTISGRNRRRAQADRQGAVAEHESDGSRAGMGRHSRGNGRSGLPKDPPMFVWQETPPWSATPRRPCRSRLRRAAPRVARPAPPVPPPRCAAPRVARPAARRPSAGATTRCRRGGR